MHKTDELRTARIDTLVTPEELAQQLPVGSTVAENVTASRKRIERILSGDDKRLLVIVGPCSIHDIDAAVDYAQRLATMRDKYQNRLEIVMRTYFEKPRTVIGWKGLISDPDLNGSYRVNHGIRLARELLLKVNELGVPTATEFLDMVTGQYIADLISWGAIGARTTESQIHREMASALSCPVGFKNGTDGNTRIAIDAIRAARSSHMFLSPDKHGQMTIYQTSGNPYGHIIMRGGKTPNYHADDIASACDAMRSAAHSHRHFGVDSQGHPAIVESRGNPDTHLVLRGGHSGPNYDRASVAKARAGLEKSAIPARMMVDCSHANSGKDPLRQPQVFNDVLEQRLAGDHSLIGMMLESHLFEGCQSLSANMRYGVSVTDGCLGWDATEQLLRNAAHQLQIQRHTAKAIV